LGIEYECGQQLLHTGTLNSFKCCSNTFSYVSLLGDKKISSKIENLNKKWFQPVKKSKWKPLTDTWPKNTEYRYWHPHKEDDLSKSIKWFGGIDVHLKDLTVGIYGIDRLNLPKRVLGPIISVNVSDTGYMELFDIFDYFDLKQILMETTGVYSFDPYYRCRARYTPNNQESRVICMNAHDLSKLLVKNKKTDKVDSSRLAFLASVPELLRESYIPTREEYILRLMLRQRNKYKSESTKNKNRFKTLLAAGGFRWKFDFGNKGLMQLLILFIEQERDIVNFIHDLEQKQDLPKVIQRAIGMHKNKLLEWSTYVTNKLERLNLKILLGLKDKFEGFVDFYDKLIFEQLLTLPRFQGPMELIKDLPGMGEWTLATILLETGPINRFPTVGAYLSYAGVTKGIADSGEKSVKKGNNPHSHRILKQAYRTIGIILLGLAIRADKGQVNDDFQHCHPLIKYAQKICAKQILNGKKANKIAAKAARIVYGILKSGRPYNNCHEENQFQERQICEDKNKLVVRYSAFQRQIALLKTSYEEIAERSTLIDEPFMADILTMCETIFRQFNREQHLHSLRKYSKEIRKVKMSSLALRTRTKKTLKKKISKKKALKQYKQESNNKKREEGSEKEI
jgi:transposase